MRETRICEGVTYLIPDTMRSFQACAGLKISSGATTALVDANMGLTETPALLTATRPDLAVMTHYHVDHSAWASTVAELTSARILAPAQEVAILAAPEPLHLKEARARGFGQAWERFMADTVGYAPVPSVTPYDHGTPLRIGRLTLETLDTRGHSPGHTALYLAGPQILFCGDLGIDRFGPWYGWPNCDLVALVGSLLRMRGLPQKLLLTSHGGIRDRGFEAAWTEAIFRVLTREAHLEMDLSAGRSREAVVETGIFFCHKAGVPEPMRRFLYMWDEIMYDHHQAVLAHGGLTQFFPELKDLAASARERVRKVAAETRTGAP
ncbi:MAG: MBL fold metallo-hydrolase [Desulfosarcinaceae bacterium]|nr:MBL fold metallo-hydrolase [Desulfosarcinaceae bacterium]